MATPPGQFFFGLPRLVHLSKFGKYLEFVYQNYEMWFSQPIVKDIGGSPCQICFGLPGMDALVKFWKISHICVSKLWNVIFTADFETYRGVPLSNIFWASWDGCTCQIWEYISYLCIKIMKCDFHSRIWKI